jgi:hypothetical protein
MIDDIDDPLPEASHGAVSTAADGLGELLGDACGALARVLNAIHYLSSSELRAHARSLTAVREMAAGLPVPRPRDPVGFRSRRRKR